MSEIHLPMIYSCLTQAAAAINAVGKNGVNTSQGWKFRSIDDIYNALNPALIAAGLTIVPNVIHTDIVQQEASTNQYGKKQPGATTARLTMEYTVFAPDGSSIKATTIGEGRDAGDKACNKAMAIAYKYMAFQLFCIPTEEMRRDDPDLYSPENAPQMAGAQNGINTQPDTKSPSQGKNGASAATQSRARNVQVVKIAPTPRIDRKQLMAELATELKTDMAGVKALWEAVASEGKIPAGKSSELTDEQFTAAIDAIRDFRNITRG